MLRRSSLADILMRNGGSLQHRRMYFTYNQLITCPMGHRDHILRVRRAWVSDSKLYTETLLNARVLSILNILHLVMSVALVKNDTRNSFVTVFTGPYAHRC